MTEPHLEVSQDPSKDDMDYIVDGVTDFGMSQMKGEEPTKVCCTLKGSDGSSIGGILGATSKNMFFISHLYVDEQYRGNGYGERLIFAIENEAKKHNCNILRLNTFNKDAARLYLKLGYSLTVEIKEYMDGWDLMYFEKRI